MGTGSFGGGSGSLGGGSGSGGRGGSGNRGASGSLQRAVKGLLDLTKRLRQDPDQTRLTQEVLQLLKDRGRRTHIQALLSDPFTNGVLSDLVGIERKVEGNTPWVDIARSFDLPGDRATMRQIADAVLDRNYKAQHFSTDERYVDAVSRVISELLLESVGQNHRIFSTGSVQAIERSLNRAYFANTSAHFIGKLIAFTIKADTVHDLGASNASISRAAESVADAIYGRFARKFLDVGKAKREDVLRIISENFNDLVSA
jgi:hypothetical protein